MVLNDTVKATDTIWPGRDGRRGGQLFVFGDYGDGCVFLTVCANTAMAGYFDTVGDRQPNKQPLADAKSCVSYLYRDLLDGAFRVW